MKPPPFTYHRPRTAGEAVQMLAELGGADGGVKVLAGGQSLVPLMSMRLAAPGHLVDINHIPGLDAVEVTEGGVRVGALARHAAVERDEAAHEAVPLLRQALSQVAHPAVRNRGTSVGSLVHADPAAELPAVLLLLEGSVELIGPAGAREVPAADFFTGPMQSATGADELAVAATFHRPPPGTRTAFLELARRSGDYALCGVAVLLTRDADGVVADARAALVSVGDGPVPVDLRPAITGSGDRLVAERVHELVDQAVDPEDDIHATAAYRRHLARVLTMRAVEEAA